MYFCVCLVIINSRLVIISGWVGALIFVFSYFHVFLCVFGDYQCKVGYYIWVGWCTYFRIFMYFCVYLVIINARLVVTSGWVDALIFVFSHFHVFLCVFGDYQCT